MEFQPMSPEEMQQAMQFLLQQQTQFAADLARTEARWTTRFGQIVDRTDQVANDLVGLTEVVGELGGVMGRLTGVVERLTGVVERLTGVVDQLAVAQQRTDEQLRTVESHLNIVITMFERHLREDHGHRPS